MSPQLGSAGADPADPALLSASQLLDRFARRRLSPVEALEAVLARIQRLNPVLNAFAVVDEPAARRCAIASEHRWLAGRPLGPLDGVPTTVKDLVDLAGHPTRRGSLATSDAPVQRDAPLVLGLRAAGAVILGKTTTTEFGWKSPGDCPLHGITRNPHHPDHTPGGSSSGAGAAAGAGFGALHVGTDAGGSIRIPAAWCGVVGLKPSFGLVPQWPPGAFAHVAVAGPMTRCVRDAALMLGAIGRFDPRDPFALPDGGRDWSACLGLGVEGLRVAVLRRPGFDAPADGQTWNVVEGAARALEAAGARVEDASCDLPDARAVFGRIWSAALARLVATIPPGARALLDLGLLGVAERAGSVSAADWMTTEALRLELAHRLALFHLDYDLILCPATPSAAPRADAAWPDPESALWTDWAPWTLIFNLSRGPAIVVPAGLDKAGLPRAVQLAATLYRDDLVLRGAAVVEASFGRLPTVA